MQNTFGRPAGLRNTFYRTPEEAAQAAEVAAEARVADLNSFERGLRQGLHTTPAMLADAAAVYSEPFAPKLSNSLRNWAGSQYEAAQGIPMPASTWEEVEQNPLKLGSYVAGKAGQNIPQLAVTLPAGAVGFMAGGPVGGAGAMYAANAALVSGEHARTLYEDPVVMANTTPEERALNTAGYAAPAAALDTVGDVIFGSRLTGTGKALRAGVMPAVKHMAKTVPEAAVTEGVPEVGQQALSQYMHGRLNPERDASGDTADLKEAFFGGWAGGSGLTGAGRAVQVGKANADAAREWVGEKASSVRNKLADMLRPSSLPPELANASDEEVLAWDQQQSRQKAEAAQTLAEDVLADGTSSQTLRQRAAEYMQRVKQGAVDAWQDFASAVDAERNVQRVKDGFDRFTEAARSKFGKGSGVASGSVQFTDDDAAIMRSLESYLPSNFRETADIGTYYRTLREALLDPDPDLPWGSLIDTFGNERRATAALGEMHRMMAREGVVTLDPQFESRIATLLKVSNDRDNSEVERLNAALLPRHGSVDRATAIRTIADIRQIMRRYGELNQNQRRAFDERMQSLFGPNAEAFMRSLVTDGGETVYEDAAEVRDLDDQQEIAQRTIQEIEGADVSFVGSSKVQADPDNPDAMPEGSARHGGFFRLDRTNPELVKQIRARMDAAKKAATEHGAVVRELSPLEYARSAGIDPEVIARELGTSVDNLASHPARMLRVESKNFDRDPLDITTEEINQLSKTKGDLSPRRRVSKDEANQVAAALKLKAGSMFKRLRELGMPHAKRVIATPDGPVIEMNLNHGGAGHFNVLMKDGSRKTLSAKDLIARQRKASQGQDPGASQQGVAELQRQFTSAVSSLLNNPDVQGIEVLDYWGKVVADTSGQYRAKDGGAPNTAAAAKRYGEIMGAFGPYFELMSSDKGRVTLGEAARAQVRGDKGRDAEREYLELDERIDALLDEIDTLAEELGTATGKQAEAIERRINEIKLDIEELQDQKNDGYQQALIGKDNDGATSTQEITDAQDVSDRRSPKARRFQEETGEVLGQPARGKPKPVAEGRMSQLDVSGVKMTVPRGVQRKHFTGEMVRLLNALNKAAPLVSTKLKAQLDTAAQRVAKAAQANMRGDKDALISELAKARELAVGALNAAIKREENAVKRGVLAKQVRALGGEPAAFEKDSSTKESQNGEEKGRRQEVLSEQPVTEDNPSQADVAQVEKEAPERQPVKIMPMYFTDGILWRGVVHNMRPEFRGRSTMDLIKSGDRTATSRKTKPDVRVGQIIEFRNKTGDSVLVRVTKAPYKVSELTPEQWSKLEGWEPALYESYKESWQFQYELVDRKVDDINVVDSTNNTKPQEDPKSQADIDAEIDEANNASRERDFSEYDFSEYEQQAEADKAEVNDTVDEVLDEYGQLDRAMKELAAAMKASYRRLADTVAHGYFTNTWPARDVVDALVEAVREAMRKLIEVAKAAGPAANKLRKQVQSKIAELQRQRTEFKAHQQRVEKAMSDARVRIAERIARGDKPAMKPVAKELLAEMQRVEARGPHITSVREPTERELIAAEELLRMVEPLGLGQHFDHVVVMDKGSMFNAAVNPPTKTLYLSEKDLAVALGDTKASNGYARAFYRVMVHELVHMADATGSENIFGFRYVKAPKFGSSESTRLQKGGDLYKEAERVNSNPKNAAFFAYPLNVALDSNIVPAELAAQALSVYYTNPVALLRVSPMFYDYSKEIADALVGKDRERVRRAFQGIREDGGDPSNPSPGADTGSGRAAATGAAQGGSSGKTKQRDRGVQQGARTLSQGAVDRIVKRARPLIAKLTSLVVTAQNTLIDSDNTALERIGREFSNETGSTGQRIGFLSARVQKGNEYLSALATVLKGHEKITVQAALRGLQSGNLAQPGTKVREVQDGVRKLLDDLYDYMREAGVDVKKRKNFFPRVWSPANLMADPEAFLDQLADDYLKVKGKKLNPKSAQGVLDVLLTNRGAEPVSESDYHIGYTPFMQSTNARKLDYLVSDYSQFQADDLVEIMSTYISQAVHRAEYARRFGNDGAKLRAMLTDAFGEEVDKNAGRKVWAAAKEKAIAAETARAQAANEPVKEITIEMITAQLKGVEDAVKKAEEVIRTARKAVMAMEGTLGANAPEGKFKQLLRRYTPAMIVYQNVRLLWLSLFSQFIDPLGVMVRGGTAKQAFDAYVRGLRAVIHGWRGTEAEDSAWALARKLGVIDATNMLNTMGNMYSSVHLDGAARKINDALFRWNGVEQFTQGVRVGATIAAVDFIKFHLGKGDRHSDRYLSELGLKKGDKFDLDDPKIREAVFRWVEGAIVRPNAALRPSWASDPHYALFFHMKQFTYAFHKVILERMINEAKHGNYDPAFVALAAYVPVMVAADVIRGFVGNGGDEPPWMRRADAGDIVLRGVERAGLLGIPQIGKDALDWGPLELGGPMVEQVAETIANMVGGDFNKAWRDALPAVNVIREALS